ncbi:MAG: cysteine desulfurase NifS [Candidatus Bathyarchaeota archaeon]|nr:cysteine desulfurase NifS [Candidatus Bathyarchaeota archaeon]
MDYAATTPVDDRVLEAMKPFFSKKYGNASSMHSYGQDAKNALDNSRHILADSINAKNNEIVFTGSGSEADNLAIKGVAFANRFKGKHIITSSIEHHAVLEPCEWLEKQGFDLTILPVDKSGLVDPSAVETAIRKDTILVSIMHANNEIGTIEPIDEIGRICKENDVYFHTDAVQTFGKISIDIEKMNVDLLSTSAHKLYGPKGVGCLYVRDDVKIEPLIHGGKHEFGLRSSTENIAGIVGFGKAVELRKGEMPTEMRNLTKLRTILIKEVIKIEDAHLNGHSELRLPNNANFWFKFIEGESLMMDLSLNGVSASTGSACSSKSLKASHVLLAIGLKPEEAHGSLRLSLGKYNTAEDVEYVLNVLPKSVEKLRKISPFKRDWNSENNFEKNIRT